MCVCVCVCVWVGVWGVDACVCVWVHVDDVWMYELERKRVFDGEMKRLKRSV